MWIDFIPKQIRKCKCKLGTAVLAWHDSSHQRRINSDTIQKGGCNLWGEPIKKAKTSACKFFCGKGVVTPDKSRCAQLSNNTVIKYDMFLVCPFLSKLPMLTAPWRKLHAGIRTIDVPEVDPQLSWRYPLVQSRCSKTAIWGLIMRPGTSLWLRRVGRQGGPHHDPQKYCMLSSW